MQKNNELIGEKMITVEKRRRRKINVKQCNSKPNSLDGCFGYCISKEVRKPNSKPGEKAQNVKPASDVTQLETFLA